MSKSRENALKALNRIKQQEEERKSLTSSNVSSEKETRKTETVKSGTKSKENALKALDRIYEQQGGKRSSKTFTTKSSRGAIALPAVEKSTVGNSSAQTREPLRVEHDAEYWRKRFDEEMDRLKIEHANDPGFPFAAHAIGIVEEEKKREEYILKHQDNDYADNFFGQFGANYRVGDISERSTEAMADYLRSGNKADFDYAYELDELAKRIQENNKDVFADDATLPWVSEDFAGYLPQFLNQTGPQLLGGGIGGAAGGLIGSRFGPEGAVLGAKYGAKAGAVAASGYDSYDRMKASAFKGLIELGADEETARAAANDEAILGAITEMGDTWFTLSKFGYGAVLNSLGKSTAKKTATSGLKKLGGLLGKYGLNIEQERAEEGIQGAIGVANRRRVYNDITRKADEEIGQYGKGNVDLYNRPQYKYPDGLTATVESASFNIDGEIVLLPTIAYDANGNAIRLTNDEAFRRYVETGEYLGKFKTEEEATAYANKLHLAQDYYYSDNKDEYTDNGMWGLTKDAGKVLMGVDFGTEDDATIAEIKEQKRAGGAIAAIMGLPGTAVDVGTNAYIEGKRSKVKKIGNTYSVDTEAVIEEGLESDLKSESHKIASELKRKLDAGETISNEEIGRAVIANEIEIQRENAQPTTLEEAAEALVRESEEMDETFGDSPRADIESPASRDITPSDVRAARINAMGEILAENFESDKDRMDRTALGGSVRIKLPQYEVYVSKKGKGKYVVTATPEDGTQVFAKKVGEYSSFDEACTGAVSYLADEKGLYGELEDVFGFPPAQDGMAVNSEVSEEADTTPTETKKADIKTILHDGEKSVGVVDGQSYVTDGLVALPVKDTDTAKAEFGASETKRATDSVSSLLKGSFTPISKSPVEGNLEGIGTVRVFTDDSGREIALKKDVAESLEGYNLEATFRGGKPYAIKATDNDGNVAAVAMAVGLDKSGETYNTTEVVDTTKTNVPYNVMSNENPVLQERFAREGYIKRQTGFGDFGVKAFTDIMEGVTESEGPAVASEFNVAYRYGLLDANESTIDSSSFVQKIAFNAGKQDYLADLATKEANAPNVISHGDKAGFDRTTSPANVSKEAIDIVDNWAKEMGVVVIVADKSDKYNAKLLKNKGVVLIASDFTVDESLGEDAVSKSFVTHAMHEMLDHRAEELAPKEYMEFKREMYLYKESMSNINLADAKRKAYSRKGVEISLSEAMSEETANSIFGLFGNDIDLLAECFDRVVNGKNAKAKKGANAFLRALDYVVEKFNGVLDKLGVNEKARLKPVLDQATRIRNRLEKTLKAAVAQSKKNAAKKTTPKGEATDANTKFSAKLRDGWTYTEKEYKAYGWARANDLLSAGANDDFKAKFAQAKRRGQRFNKAKSGELIIPVSDIYDSAARGINNTLVFAKGTFDNPVISCIIKILKDSETEIDEIRRYIYGLERRGIQPQTGEDFVRYNASDFRHYRYEQHTESRYEANYGERHSRSRKENTGTVEERKVGKKYSIKDSDGNTLSKEQQEYFKDSKVRDENGNLLVMYHGTDADFFVFEKRKGDRSLALGINYEVDSNGFFFSADEEFASKYGKKTKSYYLDVKKPLIKAGDKVNLNNLDESGKTVFYDEERIDELYYILEPVIKDVLQYEFEHSYSLYEDTNDNIKLKKRWALKDLWAYFDGDILTDMALPWEVIDNQHFAKSVSRMEELGYDGLLVSEGEDSPRSWFVLKSNQAKLTSNTNPTNDPDIRFSLKEPVEETKNLVALHNLTEEKLLKTLALGGFPMPSIAVTKADIPHTNFGDITLVMNKSAIDPQANKKNTVYSADAWTPVVPSIEYEVNPEAESRLRNKFYDLSRKYGRDAVEVMYSYGNTLEDQLNRNGGAEGIIARLKDDTKMMNVYLLDIGKEQVENVYKEKVSRLSDADIERNDFIINGLGEDVLNETYPPEGESPMTTRKKWLEAHGEKLETVYADYLKSTGMTADVVADLMSNDAFKANRLFRDVVIPARNYLKNGAETRTREYDGTATNEAIRNAVDTKAYEKWLQDNFGDTERSQGIYNNKDYYMPSGKRRSFAQTHYPVTLENIVKVMTSKNDGNTKNVSGFVGIKTLRAGTAERFKSIADMHKRSDRLQHLTEAEAEAINDALSQRMNDIMSRVLAKSKYANDNPFIAMDAIGETLNEVAESGTYTIDNISKIFAKYGYNIGNTIATDIRDLLFDVTQMPVNIFEAKPERAVGFDEVLAAILPDSASDKLRTQLEQAGVPILTYEKGNDADRLAKVNSVENAKFSLKGTEKSISFKDVEKVGKAIAAKDAGALAKYAESGAISTEFYNQLIEDYGVIPKGEKPFRDVSVPRKTADGKKVSQTVRTILEAKATPEEAVPTIEKMVEDGVFSYDSYTDKQAIENTEEYLTEHGWQQSFVDWLAAVNAGEVSKDQTTMGWALYNNAVNRASSATSEDLRKEATETALIVLDAMVRHQRSAAQALQATRILKKMSPETQLYGVQKSVEAFQKELTDKYGDKAPDLKIDESLAEQFLTAKTEEARAEVEAKIYKDIGRQMPSRFIDKWNAWRYLAMLGNTRTHVRNIGGNAGFAPVVALKNMTATAIESAVHRVSGGKTSRSKAFVGLGKADKALLKAAWDDYANVADMISSGGKYNDFALANQAIEEGRQIFKFKPLEWARKGNSKLLDMEDMWFAKPHYANALAQYCKANKITAEQLKRGKALGAAREYAIKEAQKATYRDTNAFSQMVSGWGRGNKNEKNVAKKAFNTAVEGILPFRKTPANILVRGVEYSPIGLLKGLSYDLYRVGKGEITSAQAIDNISAGLTGTGLLALGVWLAAEGLIRGHGEDDEEKEFKEMMGHQSYALELPNGTSVTLDWLAPEALPFFVGANIWETTKGTDEEVNLSTILQAVSGISEPMLEMSCLSSLNDLFESVGYASSNDTSGLVSVLSSAVTSYLTQGLPTILGQAERTGDENRMTTYTEKNSFLTKDLQYTLGKASAKIPFWDYNQIPYIDAWGRKEASGTALERGLNNFLNPAYTSTIETSSMEKELLRLYEKTGEASVFPKRADKYFMVDGVRKDLTKEEYVRYATLKGEKSRKVVSDLVKSKSYKNLSNEEKVKAIEEAYDYANQKAKEAISKYKPETWVKNADGFGSSVGNYLSFKAEVASTREANGDKISKEDAVDIILDMAQNDTETWNMYLSMFDSTGANYAKDNGVDGSKYVEFIDVLDKVDEPNENGKLGTYTNDEITEAIKNVPGISNRDRAILWQSFKVGKSSKNNPWRNYLP